MASFAVIRAVSKTSNVNSLLTPAKWKNLIKTSSISSSVIYDRPNTNTMSKLMTPQKFELQQIKSFSVTPSVKAAPEIEQSGHDHVLHWTAERILSVVLLASIPAAVVFPYPSVEYFLALSVTLHSHWGIEAIVVDYARPSVIGNFLSKLSLAAVYGLSVMTLGGLCYFIYTDVGIVTAVKMLWRL